jgi:O-antigen ligase
MGGVIHHTSGAVEYPRARLFSESRFVLWMRMVLIVPLLLPAVHALGFIVFSLTGSIVMVHVLTTTLSVVLIFQFCVIAALVLFFLEQFTSSSLRFWLVRGHFVLLGAWVMLSFLALIGMDSNVSFFGTAWRADGLIFLFFLFVYAVLLAVAFQEECAFDRLLFWLMGGAVATVACSGVYILLEVDAYSAGILREFARRLFGNENFAAHYFLLSLAVVVGGRIFGPWRLVVGVLLFSAIMSTGSVIAIVFAAVLVAVVMWRHRQRWMVYGAALVMLVGAGWASAYRPHLLDRVRDEAVQTAAIRFDIWNSAIVTASAEHLWTGVGWGNEFLLWNDAARLPVAQHFTPYVDFDVDRLHNVFVTAFVTGGVVGLLLAGMLLLWIIGVMRRHSRSGAKYERLLVAVFVMQAAYLMVNFDSPMSRIVMAVVFAGLLSRDVVVETPRALEVWSRGGMVFVLATSVYVGAWWFAPAMEASVARAQIATSFSAYRENNTQHANFLVAAFDQSTAETHPYDAVRDDAVQALLKRRDGGSLIMIAPERLIPRVRTQLDGLVERHPGNAQYLTMRGHLERNVLGDPTTSLRYFQQALLVTPADDGLRLRLALNHISLGQLDEAEEHLEPLDQSETYHEPAQLYRTAINFIRGEIVQGERRFSAELSTYMLNGPEWDILLQSYTRTKDDARLLEWLDHIWELRTAFVLDTHLAARILRISESTGRQEVAMKILEDMLQRGYQAERTSSGSWTVHKRSAK